MAITHYGLDSAEIEHLKAANLTDEEINDLNKKRVQEQMDDEKDDNTDTDFIAPNKDIERISKLLPNVHPAIVAYIATAPAWQYKKNDDGYIKEAFSKLQKNGGIDNANKSIQSIFAEIETPEDIWNDFSDEAINAILQKREDLINEATADADAEEKRIGKDCDALMFASEIIKNMID